MRKQLSLQSTKRNVLIWTIAGILICLISLLVYFLVVYNQAIEEKKATFPSSKQEAIQETPLIEVLHINRYNGQKAYDIIKGKTESDEIGFALVPVKDDLEILFVKESEGVSQSDMVSIWEESCTNCELDKISLGIDKGNFIWEIIYKNQNDKYIFASYLFSNGKLYEQLK
jgi:uncharacterized protein YpmB